MQYPERPEMPKVRRKALRELHEEYSDITVFKTIAKVVYGYTEDDIGFYLDSESKRAFDTLSEA